MSPSDIPSPGGWLRLLNSSIARKLYLSTAALGVGAFVLYGEFQGAQASHYCEAQLASATANTVTYSCRNPLEENQSGAILFSDNSFVLVAESTGPVTRLNVCTSSGASQPCTKATGSSDVMSGVVLTGTNRVLAISETGSVLTANGTPAILAPRNYAAPAKKYLNFTFTVNSGATITGNPSSFARFEVVPCNLDGVGC